MPALCPQDHLEPLLVDAVREQGGEIRFGTTLTGLRVTPDGEYVQAIFRAGDLAALTGQPVRPVTMIVHPEAEGVLIPVGADRWEFAHEWFPERGETPDHSVARWTALLRTATGLPGLEPEILSVLPFTMAADVATSYRAGNGFLAGDAAHRMTPVGAVGLNTALHDGHELGWRLAWATRGLAGEALLDSYAVEREPVGRANAERSLRRGEPDPPTACPATWAGPTTRRSWSAPRRAGPVPIGPPAPASAPHTPGSAPGDGGARSWTCSTAG
jgi:2-polyprenyl-6-methoxyphenol hydroxylase-like FAD-dependent oxidoreductase